MSRADLFNKVIERQKYQSYLEIGVDNPNSTFNLVNAKSKWAVDPYYDTTQCHVWNEHNKVAMERGIKGTFKKMTSDEFFASIKGIRIKWDVIFIDGLHTEEQVDKDIENALLHLKVGGIIFIDDCHPTNQYHTKMPPDPGQPWMGTVYRSLIKQVQRNWDPTPTQIAGCIDKYTGMGYVVKTNKRLLNVLSYPEPRTPVDWKDYFANRHSMLCMATEEYFLEHFLPTYLPK